MRVGMLAQTYLPDIGGAEIHVQELSKALRRKGNEVEIFSNTSATDSPIRDGVQRLPWGINPFTAIVHMKALSKYCERFDVLHSHYSSRLSYLATHAKGVKPLVLTLHGLGTLDREDWAFPNKQIHYFFREKSLKKADHVISTSEELASIAQRFIPRDKISVIPNGVDTEFFHPCNARPLQEWYGGRKIVLTVRRLVPKTGIQFLVEAIPLMLQMDSDIQFVFAGDGRIRHVLERRVKQLGIGDNVAFLGSIDRETVRDYLGVASAVVFPSTAESTSLSCLEAMSMERPVVVSDIDTLRDMVGNNERGIAVGLFDCKQSNYAPPERLEKERLAKLADTVVGILHNTSKVRSIGRNARKFVTENFGWPLIAKKTIDVYEDVLKGAA